MVIEEWETEPNFLEGDFYGLHCRIVRNDLGTLCGYVAVPKKHPYFKYTDYYEPPVCDLKVHGGITYLEIHKGPVKVYGFDCGHFGDICPKFPRNFPQHGTYKNIEYVKQQVENLAKQLAGNAKEKEKKKKDIWLPKLSLQENLQTN